MAMLADDLFCTPASWCLWRVQRRLGIWAYTLIVLSLVVFWFISFGSCSRYSFQYYGLPPVEVRPRGGAQSQSTADQHGVMAPTPTAQLWTCSLQQSAAVCRSSHWQ
jgi:hypothetical protein